MTRERRYAMIAKLWSTHTPTQIARVVRMTATPVRRAAEKMGLPDPAWRKRRLNAGGKP